MKKRITIILVAVLVAGGIGALAARRQFAIRYHVWQSGRLYSKAMVHCADAEQRERFRNLSVQHCDALVALGYWRRVDIPVHPMLTVEEQTNFMRKVDWNIPRDISYYQMWGAANPARMIIRLWCQSDRLDTWTGFLKKENLLLERECRQTSPGASLSRVDTGLESPQE
jgi:hypothetical protein